ncbi:hypothetical protein GA840_01375 [Pediococcus ethanolidurans]|uniref:hypothetical protein n=1 Tax=Pediococcus ethanolidurans TaxID=319653 RepID=UPI002953FF99|nr:hypothetical protein [Pediococcus ethanolidurans]MDV7718532.1 hypothetical protein [Pediococcus ethanolidurans]
MVCIKPLTTFPVLEDPNHVNDGYFFNVYVYNYQLVGGLEATNYKQSFETEIFTPVGYITWRFNVCWWSP